MRDRIISMNVNEMIEMKERVTNAEKEIAAIKA